MADLLMRLVGEDAVSGVFGNAGNAVKLLATEIIKFGKESQAAADEQEKADRRLQRAAGELAGTFKTQASAMQEQLGVSDDMVQTMQSMLLEFGQAPGEVEATTRALLDLSAATGRDALSATKELLGATQSGKTAFKELALEYEKTGNAGKDLAGWTQALAGKFGGAAQDEANSVAGQARLAAAAVGEFQESIGGLINAFISKTGAVGTFTQAIKDLQERLFGAAEDSAVGIQKNLDVATLKLAEMKRLLQSDFGLPSWATGGFTQEEIDAQIAEVKRLEAAWAEVSSRRRAAMLGGEPSLPGVGKADGRATGSGGDAAAKAQEKALEDRKKHFSEMATAAAKAHEKDLEDLKEHFSEMARAEDNAARDSERRSLEFEERESKRSEAIDARLDRERLKNLARQAKEEEDRDEHLEQRIDKDLATQKRMADLIGDRNDKFEADMASAGAQVGAAFVNALSSALEKSLSGEEVDGNELAIDFAATAISIIGSAVGTVYPVVGALISGIGGAAISVGKSVYKADKKMAAKMAEKAAGKKHDGGLIGEYHTGGWPGMSANEEMAILERGEVVWSRQQVASSGGPAAVDQMRKGGGGGRGVSITVVAQDSKGVREFFEGPGGRGLFNAQRTGRGDVARLFGGR